MLCVICVHSSQCVAELRWDFCETKEARAANKLREARFMPRRLSTAGKEREGTRRFSLLLFVRLFVRFFFLSFFFLVLFLFLFCLIPLCCLSSESLFSSEADLVYPISSFSCTRSNCGLCVFLIARLVSWVTI